MTAGKILLPPTTLKKKTPKAKKLESNRDFTSSYQFTGNAENRGDKLNCTMGT